MTSLPTDASRIGACLAHHAAQTPDGEACVHDSRRVSFGELHADVTRWSKALMAAGIEPGDRVAMLTAPCIEWLTLMLAVTDIGAIWLGYHPRYQLPEFQHVTDLAGPKVIIAFRSIHGRDYSEELNAIKGVAPGVENMIMLDDADTFLAAGGGVSDDDLDCRRNAVQPDDTAIIIFTSGTTGQPKGAMVRHRALLTGAKTELEHWPSSRLRILHMMPVNHIAGTGMVGVFGLYAGGTLVFQDRFEAGDLLRLIEQESINFLLGSPVQFHMMAHHDDLERRDLSSLAYTIWGGAPMAKDLVERLNSLPGHLCTAFGMTELGLYATYSDLDTPLDVLSATIGRPHAGYEIRVADGEGNVAAPGAEGEIQARGDWLFAGYFGNPEATAEAYTADGWFRTGDIVKVGLDGNLEIVGRLKEMFISGGFNIYPREVEIALESHPATGLVAVLGVPDEAFGEVGHAFIELLPGHSASEDDLRAWCRDRLANYKVPKIFDIHAELPRLPIGKIDKQALKKLLA
ncbi:MAG: class I adenylate-forming enzyme family protein [Pseudomonadota bacterium]